MGGSTDIRANELMASLVYDEKSLMGMQFMCGALSFTVRKDDNLEQPAQEQ
jgi:hypothetical protein